MKFHFWTEERVAGGMLVGSLLILVAAAVIMLLSGAIAGFGPAIQRSPEVAPYVDTFRLLILLFIIGWVVQLLGLGLLSRLLSRAGAEQLALLAFLLILLAVIAAVVHFSFRMIVELWAGQEAARLGNLPTLYEPLRLWTSSINRLGYRLHAVAMIGIGWAILRTRLLARSLGWATIAWSGLVLLGALVGIGLPAMPFLMPSAVGLALLIAPSSRSSPRQGVET